VREHLAGAAASYRFRGSKLTWWTVTGPTQGKAAVYVGSRRIATVNNYAAAVHYRVARTFRHLGKGAHTLTVKALGRKGAKAGRGTFVSIDAFTVGTKRTNTPHLTSAWHRARASKFSGGHAATATLAGQAVSLRFRGTSITWTTLRNRSQGKARVYVDGVLKGTVDNYAATTLYKVRRVVRNLTDTVHTIRIVALGKHRKGGRGTTVTVDRFAIG
jgi:bacillopeptidase F